MSVANRTNFSTDVDTLARRIDARLREFGARGEFADLHGELSALADRHGALRGKLAAAEGSAWDGAKQDLAREHGAIYDEFIKWEERVDAKVMRGEIRERAPGAKSGLV